MGNEILPPYNASATCPKCGRDDIGSQFYRAGHWSYEMAVPSGEHMHRHCYGCGCSWNEAPLDAKKTTDGE